MEIEVIYENINLFGGNYFDKVRKQVNRDLMLCGFDEILEAGPAAFISAFSRFVSNLMQGDASELAAFLYRVDVDQKLLAENDVLLPKDFVKAILLRVLQKVVLKERFSRG